jgi:hypothetical protein
MVLRDTVPEHVSGSVLLFGRERDPALLAVDIEKCMGSVDNAAVVAGNPA